MIGEVQKQVLKSYIVKLATDKGVTIHPLLLNDVLNQIYATSNRQPGQPFTFPFRQEARSAFDVQGFNKFFEQLKIDVDTLFKMAVRARIEARRILLLNDIRMRGFQDRISTLVGDANNFSNRSVSNEGIYQATFTVPIKFSNYYFKDRTKVLEVDTLNGVITLPTDTTKTKIVDLTYLKNNPSAATVETRANMSELLEDSSASPLSNIGDTSASPWVHNISVNTQRPTMDIVLTITLPAVEEVNRIDFESVPGGYSNVVLEGALIADNYLPLGSITSSSAQYVIFAAQKVKKLRMTITNTPFSSDANGASFMFGIRSMRVFRNVYNAAGEVVLTDIDPFITGKTIIDATLEPVGNTPDSAQVRYSLRRSGDNSYTDISGTTVGNSVVFSVAKDFASGDASIQRTPFTLCPLRNSVKFDTILPVESGVSLIPSGITILDKYMEVRPGQNGFKKIYNPAYSTVEIQDAFVQFAGENVEVDIVVPLVLTDQPIRTHSSDMYIRLPVPAIKNDVAPVSAVNPVDRMKTEFYGLFKVEKYLTSSPNVTEDITASCSVSGSDVSIVGVTFTQKHNVKVSYLGRIDNSVHIKPETLLLHKADKFGIDGVKPENVTDYSSGKYHINEKTNKLYASKLGSTSTNSLINAKMCINFTGIFLTPKIDLYETYITFNGNINSFKLATPIEADAEYGEYATLRNIDTGTLVRLENTTQFDTFTPGNYLLTVASKPNRYYSITTVPPERPQTLFQSLLATKVDQTSFVDPSATEDVKFPVLFSLTSKQQIISSIRINPNPLQYRTLSSFLNRSTFHSNDSYSTALVDGKTQIIITHSSDQEYYIDGIELVSIKFMYFDNATYNNQGTLDLKIGMENLANQQSLDTPEVSDLKFKIRYI